MTNSSPSVESSVEGSVEGSPEVKDSLALPIAQAELLHAVLEAQTYPWLADETPTAYDEQADAAGQALEISDEEATAGWQSLAMQLNQMFDQQTSQVENSLSQQLKEKFAGRLPTEVIAQIGDRAQQLANEAKSTGQSVLDQMVVCVQGVMAQMAEDDLRVMGRPMAMVMRGNSTDEFVTATMKSVRMVEWDMLSEIEQARLSLAAARYAISQAKE